MRSVFDRAALRLFHRFEPERAHELSIGALKAGLGGKRKVPDASRLAVQVAGLDFPNPLGLAAGYDKNGEVADALLALGFGFVEIGTLTPLPQRGNPKPRIFRSPVDRAIVNRLGFNNRGHDAAREALGERQGRGGLVGVNIGANKSSTDRIGDYVRGIETFAPFASYFTVNISSPNTPGLRDLQSGDNLDQLLCRVTEAAATARQGLDRALPIFLKIAPDLVEADLDHIAASVERRGVEGVIVSNTTLSRDGLIDLELAGQVGGLSGRPLFNRSTIILAKLRERVGPDRALIGVGGVHSAETALQKIAAGADLVQIYSALVFEGAGLPSRMVHAMNRRLKRMGTTCRDHRGSALSEWSQRPLD